LRGRAIKPIVKNKNGSFAPITGLCEEGGGKGNDQRSERGQGLLLKKTNPTKVGTKTRRQLPGRKMQTGSSGIPNQRRGGNY